MVKIMSNNLNAIESFIEKNIRPYLISHGGDMEIVSFDNSILRVKLIGQCMTCPASADTFEESIKNVLLSEFKELKDVILVNDVPDDMLDMALKILNHKI